MQRMGNRMKKIISSILLLAMPCIASALDYTSNQRIVVETLPSSQMASSTTFAGAMGYTSAVTVSSFTITRVDTAFNAVVASTSTGLGAGYQRAEITIQNNDTTDKFCGYSSAGLTISNSFMIRVGATWSFAFGKGVALYCLNDVGASGTLIVGGVAWK